MHQSAERQSPKGSSLVTRHNLFGLVSTWLILFLRFDARRDLTPLDRRFDIVYEDAAGITRAIEVKNFSVYVGDNAKEVTRQMKTSLQALDDPDFIADVIRSPAGIERFLNGLHFVFRGSKNEQAVSMMNTATEKGAEILEVALIKLKQSPEFRNIEISDYLDQFRRNAAAVAEGEGITPGLGNLFTFQNRPVPY